MTGCRAFAAITGGALIKVASKSIVRAAILLVGGWTIASFGMDTLSFFPDEFEPAYQWRVGQVNGNYVAKETRSVLGRRVPTLPDDETEIPASERLMWIPTHNGIAPGICYERANGTFRLFIGGRPIQPVLLAFIADEFLSILIALF